MRICLAFIGKIFQRARVLTVEKTELRTRDLVGNVSSSLREYLQSRLLSHSHVLSCEEELRFPLAVRCGRGRHRRVPQRQQQHS